MFCCPSIRLPASRKKLFVGDMHVELLRLGVVALINLCHNRLGCFECGIPVLELAQCDAARRPPAACMVKLTIAKCPTSVMEFDASILISFFASHNKSPLL